MDFDLVIENGWIVDGVSLSIYRGTIGVRNERVACVRGREAALSGKRVIDAGEYVVAPGFVDVHSHADHFLLLDPAMKNKLLQGVTTEIGGNCGSSAYPWNDANLFHLDGMEEEFGWDSLSGFLEALEEKGIGINFGSLVGLDSLRREVPGNSDADMKELKRLLAGSLEEGALGLSMRNGVNLGSRFDDSMPEELFGLVAGKGGVVSAHLRSESSGILDALSDTISLAAESEVSLQISHFKTLDRFNWQKQETALELLDKVWAMGMDLGIDCFPYTACCSPLSVLFPAHIAGDNEALAMHAKNPVLRYELEQHLAKHFPEPEAYGGLVFPYLESPEYGHLRGVDLLTASAKAGVEPSALVIDLALAEGLERFAYHDCMSAGNVKAAIALDCAMVASDSFPTGEPEYFKNSIIHPRTFATFPQYLSEFVYEKHIFDLPSAIKKITSIPASKFGLSGRGVIGAGAFADITIFDPENLRPGASLADPCATPSGIEYVIVNGRVAVDHGEFKDAYAGKALRSES